MKIINILADGTIVEDMSTVDLTEHPLPQLAINLIADMVAGKYLKDKPAG